jgi:hypothetical protein
MDEEQWDGHRMVEPNTGKVVFRVRGARVCDVNSGTPKYRIRNNDRIVDINSGQLVFRIRDSGRVVDPNSGQLRYRLRD